MRVKILCNNGALQIVNLFMSVFQKLSKKPSQSLSTNAIVQFLGVRLFSHFCQQDHLAHSDHHDYGSSQVNKTMRLFFTLRITKQWNAPTA